MAALSLQDILAFVRICAWVGLRNESELRAESIKAINGGTPMSVIREAVLQTYLFAGYAATINAFIVLNEVSDGNQDFFQEESGSLEEWRKRGERLCRKIYGSQYEKLIHNMKLLHPDLGDWMLWEGYGKVLSREFLSPPVRELLIVAMTAVLRVERQFHSHVRGALNVGATVDQLRSVFEEIRPHLGDAAERYDEILERVCGGQGKENDGRL